MSVKRIFLLIVLLFSFSFFAPKTSKAADVGDVLTQGNFVVVKIYEGVEYLFTFKIENKVQVLEKHAERRLVTASGYAEDGNEEGMQSQLQDYLQIKERQDGLLAKIDSGGEVLGMVEERTLEQQKTMEEIKTKVEGDVKQVVVQTQEQVVNQVAQRIVVTNGTEGQTEFFQKVEHVWAPGTGPGGTSGVVVEGGTMQFAPGTSTGGPAGSDIKTNVVVTGGGENNVVEGGDGGGLAPGTTSGGGNTIDAGTVDPGGSGTETNVIDP